MGLPTGVEGRERGDESAEETDQKPVAVATPPVVETVCTPSAASPSDQTEVFLAPLLSGAMFLSWFLRRDSFSCLIHLKLFSFDLLPFVTFL